MDKDIDTSHLSEEQRNICFLKGTEAPGSGKYYLHDKPGTYVCVVCNQTLFSSNSKFHSDTGWPSFFEPVGEKSVEYVEDNSHGMNRTEVQCGNCGSHLGHVFDDGPEPSGKRYCINSLALDFKPRE